MEHQLRPLRGKDRHHPVTIADVAQDGSERHVGLALAQLEIDGVQVELAAVGQDQLARMPGRDLAGQLAADRAAGAGDQDTAAPDQLLDRGMVVRELRSAQQVLQRNRSRADGAVLGGVLQLGQPGQPGHSEAELARLLEQPALGRAVEQRRIGEDQALHARPALMQARHDRRQIAQAAEHCRAMDVPAPELAGVVQDADHAVGHVRIGAAGANELLRGIAGAHEQHRECGRATGLRQQPVVAQHPIGKARAAQAHDQQTPLDEGHRARDEVEPVQGEGQGQKDQNRDGCRLRYVEQIDRRGVAPDTPIHAKQMKRDAGDASEHGDGRKGDEGVEG